MPYTHYLHTYLHRHKRSATSCLERRRVGASSLSRSRGKTQQQRIFRSAVRYLPPAPCSLPPRRHAVVWPSDASSAHACRNAAQPNSQPNCRPKSSSWSLRPSVKRGCDSPDMPTLFIVGRRSVRQRRQVVRTWTVHVHHYTLHPSHYTYVPSSHRPIIITTKPTTISTLGAPRLPFTVSLLLDASSYISSYLCNRAPPHTIR